MTLRIGLISDTHDHFDPNLPRLFRGVTHIIHAGDIGQPTILDALELIAPVTAVLGNNDYALRLRLFEFVRLGPVRILVHHIVNPQLPSEAVRQRLLQDRPDVVVCGHTHKPAAAVIGRTLFLNPGYAGRPRFGYPRSVALLHCEEGYLRPEIIDL